MTKLIFNRLAASLVAIFGASVLAFVLLRVAPADPARKIAGPFATEETVEAQRVALGLRDPLVSQYGQYIGDFLTGDWGFSFSVGKPVVDQVGSRLPASIELALVAFAMALVGAVLFALLATYRRRPILDRVVNGMAFIGLGTPPFWLALIALLFFFDIVGILPGPEGRLSPGHSAPPEITRLYIIDSVLHWEWATFIDAGKHLLLPALVLGFAPWAFFVRLLRANLLEVKNEQYLVTARSKGVRRWTAFRRHALPNAFLPTLTAAGLILAQLLAGSVLVESVYQWPGVGALVRDGILEQDFAVVQAFILIGAFSYVIVNLIVDILVGIIDPRTRGGSAVTK